MSLHRQPPANRLIPNLEPGARPAVSGEYRMVNQGHKRSSASLPAVRPEIRRASSTSLPAVRPEIRRASSTSLPAVRPQPPPATGTTASEPRRYTTVRMDAIAPPLSAGREPHDRDFDFDFDFDIDADGALELDDLPSSQSMRVEPPRPLSLEGPPAALALGQLAPLTRASAPMTLPTRASAQMARISASGQMPPMTAGPILPPAPAWPMSSSSGRRSSSTMAAVDPHAVLVAFSGFGDSPTSVLGAPLYAARVIARRRALRRDLKLARLRNSPDVGLYEAALRTVDDGALRNGVVVMALLFTMMTVLAWTALRVLTGAHVIPF